MTFHELCSVIFFKLQCLERVREYIFSRSDSLIISIFFHGRVLTGK